MRNTRKKIIETVYKDEESSEIEGHDFSDSGSDAIISDDEDDSSEEEIDHQSSEDDFQAKKPKTKRPYKMNEKTKPKFTKSFMSKINKQAIEYNEDNNFNLPLFSVQDLTAADKLLPSVLNLSESDSSDDDSPKINKNNTDTNNINIDNDGEKETETKIEYQDVWSGNIKDNSEEIAKKTFLELEKHKNKMEETKLSIQNYTVKHDNLNESTIIDLLALGESEKSEKILTKPKKEDSDSEIEDWEEVKDVKGIPQQGLQLIVGIPDGVCRKTKKLDIEMIMKRKMNRVKKEYQVYMHKVHVLCWLGHGNYISQVLNNQEVLATALSLVPSKDCYPGERVDMKYVEQITAWYKDKVTLKQDKHENKFKPKAPLLKDILIQQIKSKTFSTNKNIVFAFVSMLRSLGLICRAMFNFVTVPIRPPSSELCSLSTKQVDNNEIKGKRPIIEPKILPKSTKLIKGFIAQLDGNNDSSNESENIMQLDGSDDIPTVRTRRQKKVNTKNTLKHISSEVNAEVNSVSPPKRARKNLTTQEKIKAKLDSPVKKEKEDKLTSVADKKGSRTSRKLISPKTQTAKDTTANENLKTNFTSKRLSSRKTRSQVNEKTIKSSVEATAAITKAANKSSKKKITVPKLESESNDNISSTFFTNNKSLNAIEQPRRKRSHTSEPKTSSSKAIAQAKKMRTRSAHNVPEDESKFFGNKPEPAKNSKTIKKEVGTTLDDKRRVSHKDLANKKKNKKSHVKSDLVNIIKERVKEEKEEAKKGILKGKIKQEPDEDSDSLPVESPNPVKYESDDDFKPVKKSRRPASAKKIDRRVLSTDDELPLHIINVWCEIFIEELEEWVSVDVIKGKVHCANDLYNGCKTGGRGTKELLIDTAISQQKSATHPVSYVVGWDNNSNMKDLTRRYVPHWNTVTRKQRVESAWWDEAIQPWVGPKTAKDREEDERLNRMQLEAPLPKSIAEYKNHPLYALKRHLLKFEAIYPADAATLGFVRGEAVYARDCVHVCRSRDTWLKEAKVVKLGEQPYKVVKARPKWDRSSNKLITDKPLETFGPWQVQDYEPPVAENGIVPRNPYGNVELFKDCMLPIGTVHIKLPGLSRVAKKLNIDCAPAMTGFEFNGGWSHPVYDGFVVCEEYEKLITQAWLKDQEEQERKETEKTEARVYGNWKKLIRGLLIKERLKAKYGFEEPSTSKEKKTKGPRLVVKKK